MKANVVFLITIVLSSSAAFAEGMETRQFAERSLTIDEKRSAEEDSILDQVEKSFVTTDVNEEPFFYIPKPDIAEPVKVARKQPMPEQKKVTREEADRAIQNLYQMNDKPSAVAPAPSIPNPAPVIEVQAPSQSAHSEVQIPSNPAEVTTAEPSTSNLIRPTNDASDFD